MIPLDAHVLVYAHGSRRSTATRSRAARVGLPWASALAFVRLTTNPRVFSAPSTMSAAWAQVQAWLDAPAAWTLLPTRHHRSHLGACLAVRGLGANDVPDAHLAALCLEHGLRLATTDTGFARFPQLEWFDPLDG